MTRTRHPRARAAALPVRIPLMPEHADLQSLMNSPLYQVRRILRVTQTHWDLPLAHGKRAVVREARRLMSPPRPGALAQLARLQPLAIAG